MFGKECIFSFLFFLICVLITVIYGLYFSGRSVCVLHGSIASKSQIVQLAMATGVSISGYSVYHLIILIALLIVMQSKLL
jgi:hypothetical protein